MSSINKASNPIGAATTPSLDPSPPAHGGDLGAARKLFPGAPEPFLDLSAGINPQPYPFTQLSTAMFTRLPQPAALADLVATAARVYGAPSPAHVAAGPGSQILVAQTAFLLARGRASILAPTYAEHGRVAELAGHNVVEVAEVGQLADARIAIVVNPNNPDGRLIAKDALLALADRLRRRRVRRHVLLLHRPRWRQRRDRQSPASLREAVERPEREQLVVAATSPPAR